MNHTHINKCRIGELKEMVDRFWRVMSAGAGQDYLSVLRDTPTVFGEDECAEASSEAFWRGAPYDEMARRAVKDAIGNAFAAKGQPRPLAPPIAVSAMEGAVRTKRTTIITLLIIILILLLPVY
ncbi:hypothetical protein T492DRAFT_441724 [Pavlovales sp. CCMP2436]|nr:hypothetical protein T492DRAFT_441724 [Pavlovales sp. CCMP2436]